MPGEFSLESCFTISDTLSQHPAVVRLHNGELLLSYSDYTDAMEGAHGYLTRSSDLGRSWHEPKLLLTSRYPGGGVYVTLGMQQLAGGRVLLPWVDTQNRKKYPQAAGRFHCLRSDDGGQSWLGWEPQELGLWLFCPYGKIIELGGTLLCPGWGLATENDTQYVSGLCRSYDGGVTWKDWTVIARGYSETDLTLLPDGRLLALLRSLPGQNRSRNLDRRKDQGRSKGLSSAVLPWVYFSFSDDGGQTWRQPEPTNVFGQNMNAWLTSQGTLVAACRGIDGSGKLKESEILQQDERYTAQAGYGIHFFTSADGGATWNWVIKLPDPKQRGYSAWHEAGEPCFCNLPGGRLLVIYYSYDEAVLEKLDTETMPESTRRELLRIPHVFQRRLCGAVLAEH